MTRLRAAPRFTRQRELSLEWSRDDRLDALCEGAHWLPIGPDIVAYGRCQTLHDLAAEGLMQTTQTEALGRRWIGFQPTVRGQRLVLACGGSGQSRHPTAPQTWNPSVLAIIEAIRLATSRARFAEVGYRDWVTLCRDLARAPSDPDVRIEGLPLRIGAFPTGVRLVGWPEPGMTAPSLCPRRRGCPASWWGRGGWLARARAFYRG